MTVKKTASENGAGTPHLMPVASVAEMAPGVVVATTYHTVVKWLISAAFVVATTPSVGTAQVYHAATPEKISAENVTLTPEQTASRTVVEHGVAKQPAIRAARATPIPITTANRTAPANMVVRSHLFHVVYLCTRIYAEEVLTWSD